MHDPAHAHREDDHPPHGAAHSHAPAQFGRAFAIGAALNLGFVVIEAFYGLLSHSVALLADAGHNLSDILGLLVAWGASILVRRAPSARFTYGFRRSTILAALLNAMLLMLTVGAISWESIQRLARPEPVAGATVMIVAAIGVFINGVTAWLFAAGGKRDLNLRGAFAHMAADALVSAGVVAAGALMLATGWPWIDPAVSLLVNAVIVWGAWGLLRDSVVMSLDAVPGHIAPAALRSFLEGQTGVASVHDLHVWSMSTTETALTCHLVMPGGHPGDAFLHDLGAALASRFGVNHPTVQIEVDHARACALAPDDVV